ncbi:hypothetical protein SRB5_22340 [Streptomyces sp. RB5]|uniref:Uncharacterized protein n=1 Tax=Streptomyces smaragdinus TaxID=2585196 RepID=A0A7K0CH77_9ACTN|nr:hypothetical protein [Streptomyces smaragdinus]MQY12104.1 hypothetical protein [Streptomyces smaragdinus]
MRDEWGPLHLPQLLLPLSGEDHEAVVRRLLHRADLLRQLLHLGHEQPGFAELRPDVP